MAVSSMVEGIVNKDQLGVRLRTASPVQAGIRDETAARGYGVVYTNDRSRPILIIFSCIHTVTVAASFCLISTFVNGGNTGYSGWFNTPGVGVAMYGTVPFLVPPGGTYEITQNAAGGANVILRWIEYDL